MILYREQLSSPRTTALFGALALVCGGLGLGRGRQRGGDAWAAAALSLAAFFGFYAMNYRTLVIELTPEALWLTFGVFRWIVPVANMADCQLDNEIPPVLRYGGAGIHFMLVRGRYRASFNFPEYPRVAVTFKQPVGPVREISFSTRAAEKVLQHLQAVIAAEHQETLP